MKSESNEGRLLNDEGKVICYSGTENFPKVMREYCEAMVKRGLGKIMHTSNASEPKRIPEEDEEKYSIDQVNRNKAIVEKWENDCQTAISFFKSIFSPEIKSFIKQRSDAIDETSKERLNYLKAEIERTYNSATPDRLLATRHKISALDYVYDSAGLNKIKYKFFSYILYTSFIN